jgi:hypothetical protein
LANLATSLSTMSDYPWNHRVLFQGQLIFARDLPAYFIPKLMLLQFTESALLLFLIGLGVGLWNGLRKKLWEPLALFVLWFLLPLVAIIVQNSIIYDNFRQVLFLVPPLFLLAGLAFDWLFARLKSIYFRAGILILAVLPGIISIVALHPYEYVYYNALTRGVAGAFRQYEMDYWGTAYREAALFVNQAASPDATVIIYEPFASFEPYARPNMKLIAEEQATQITSAGSSPAYDLAVISSRYNFDIRRCPAQPAIKTIERQGAILAVVKKIKPGTTDCP